MATDKIVTVKLRENLRPDESRYFVKENILPLYKRCHMAEFAFYIHEMLSGCLIYARRTLFLKLLKEAADLPYEIHNIRAGIVA